jgi:type III secretory pathway component EscR
MNYKELKAKREWLIHRLNNATGIDRLPIEMELVGVEEVLSEFESNAMNAQLEGRDYTNNGHKLMNDINSIELQQSIKDEIELGEGDYYRERNR